MRSTAPAGVIVYAATQSMKRRSSLPIGGTSSISATGFSRSAAIALAPPAAQTTPGTMRRPSGTATKRPGARPLSPGAT